MKKFLLSFLCTILFFLGNVASAQSQVKINEVMVANTMHYDNVVKNFSDWIELYNPTNSSINIRNYYFSDDLNNPAKWQLTKSVSISKAGYLLINFDEANRETNANFRLEPKGGSIYIFDASKKLVDQITYPQMNNANVSYARTSDGGNTWSMMSYPTPGKTNTTGVPASEPTSEPLFSENGGFINGAKTITLTCSTPGAVIYYTTNGDEPFDDATQITSASNMLTGKATIYSGPIKIAANQSVAIRAKAYSKGYLPSTVITQSYIQKTREITLPVFSVAVNEKYRNSSIGVWTDYNNKEKKRPSNVEFFPTLDTTSKFNYQMNVEIFAASQRAKEHKQFNIIADKRYQGNNRMKYDFFNEKLGQKRKSVTLRTSGQDGSKTMMQDGLLHVLIKDQMDIDRIAYQPAVVYINGKYNGLMNVRERTQKDYLESNYNLEQGEYDLLGKHNDYSSIRAAQGTLNEWNKMISYLKANDLKNDANYNNFINTYVDEPEVLNYFLVQTYINNDDQPNNNIKAWRPYKGSTKWRYILHDADLAMLAASISGNQISTNKGVSSTSSMGYIFYSLCKNAKFQQKFAGQYLVHAYQTFAPFRTTPIIDSLARNIEAEIQPTHDAHSSVPSLSTWKKNIESMRDYWGKRQTYAAGHVKSAFNITGSEMAFKLNYDLQQGDVYLNDIKLLRNFDGKYLQTLTYTLKSQSRKDSKFVCWDIRVDGISTQVSQNEYTGTIPAKAKEVIISPIYKNVQDTLPVLPIIEIPEYKESEITLVDTIKNQTQVQIEKVVKIEKAPAITDLSETNELVIYPNPTKGLLNIVSSNEISKIEIFSQSGALVTRINKPSSTINIDSLSDGIYFVRLYTTKGVVTKKILKQ